MSYQHTLDTLVDFARTLDSPEFAGPELAPDEVTEMQRSLEGRLCQMSSALVSWVVTLPDGSLNQVGEVVERFGAYSGEFSSFASQKDIAGRDFVHDSSGVLLASRRHREYGRAFFAPIEDIEYILDVDETVSSAPRALEYFNRVKDIILENPNLPDIVELGNEIPQFADRFLDSAIRCKFIDMVKPNKFCSTVLAHTFITVPDEHGGYFPEYQGLITVNLSDSSQMNFDYVDNTRILTLCTLDPKTQILTTSFLGSDSQFGYTAPN